MINPEYTISEIETRFFAYLSDRFGNFAVIEHLEQMEGGFEVYLYKFKISGIEDYEGRLVLRLFPIYAHPKSATWQSMIHNLLREEGLPVPRVYLASSDISILSVIPSNKHIKFLIITNGCTKINICFLNTQLDN